MLRDRDVYDEVVKLVNKVADFATDFANDVIDFINSLPSPAKLMEMAGDFVQDKLSNNDGLCLAPKCPGTHINSGVEEDLVPGLDDLEILASHHAPMHIAHQRATIAPTHVHVHVHVA